MRRLAVLLTHLPGDSPLALALTGGESAWGVQEHLTAAVVDRLNAANWQRGGGKGRRPKPLERPGLKSGPERERIGGRRTYSATEMRRLLDRHTLGKT